MCTCPALSLFFSLRSFWSSPWPAMAYLFFPGVCGGIDPFSICRLSSGFLFNFFCSLHWCTQLCEHIRQRTICAALVFSSFHSFWSSHGPTTACLFSPEGERGRSFLFLPFFPLYLFYLFCSLSKYTLLVMK